MRNKGIFSMLLLVFVFLFSSNPILANEKDDSSLIADASNNLKEIEASDELINTDQGKLSENSKYRKYDYVIDAYDVNIIVNEDNTYQISENISAHFNKEKHGIIRDIPIRNTVRHTNGSTFYNWAIISQIKVSEKYRVSNITEYKIKYKSIKIGDSKKTILGDHQYTINYLYNIGKDQGKNFDEFYFNIIGDSWDTAIGNIHFSITLPKEFDKNKIEFTNGDYGSTDHNNIIYRVDGNIITGRYLGNLGSYQALTINIELPEGYFSTDVSQISKLLNISLIIAPIILLMIAILIFYCYKKGNRKVVPKMEFYPPDNLNSAEVGLYYYGKTNKNMIVSLLIYLASRGYLKLSEENKPNKKGKNDTVIRIIKLKEYNQNNKIESLFMKGLFGKNKKTVTIDKLKYKFYNTINKIEVYLTSSENMSTIFEKGSEKRQLWIGIIIFTSSLLVTLRPVLEYEESLLLLFLFNLYNIAAVFIVILACFKKWIKIHIRVVLIVIGYLLFVLVNGTEMTSLLKYNDFYLWAAVINEISITICFILIIKMKKRTPYGMEMFARIQGFKDFMRSAQKEKLQELIEKNSAYLYDILPYAYVLGTSNTWMKKFQNLTLKAPSWFIGETYSDINSFNSYFDSTMKSTSRTLVSGPIDGGSSDTGGSSDGGSSGGGSGGGGGSSW